MKKMLVILNIFIVLTACKQQETVEKTPPKKTQVRQQLKAISYQLESAKEWLANTPDSTAINIVLAANRIDKANLAKIDSVIIPQDLTGDIAYYLPFPLNVPYLKDVTKIIFFSYPTQTFATYENGELIHTGPTNMGKKKNSTPIGLLLFNFNLS